MQKLKNKDLRKMFLEENVSEQEIDTNTTSSSDFKHGQQLTSAITSRATATNTQSTQPTSEEI